MGARRKARICALQMLFQYDISQPNVDELASSYWEAFGDDMGNVARDFSNNLALGAISRLEEIDDLIKRRAEHWRINRMAVVDRNILRLAIYEFLYESDTQNSCHKRSSRNSQTLLHFRSYSIHQRNSRRDQARPRESTNCVGCERTHLIIRHFSICHYW